MLETLLSALSVVLSLIGLITVIYSLLIKILLHGVDGKYLLILPLDEERDSAEIFACSAILKSNPFMASEKIDIAGVKSNAEHNEILEKNV